MGHVDTLFEIRAGIYLGLCSSRVQREDPTSSETIPSSHNRLSKGSFCARQKEAWSGENVPHTNPCFRMNCGCRGGRGMTRLLACFRTVILIYKNCQTVQQLIQTWEWVAKMKSDLRASARDPRYCVGTGDPGEPGSSYPWYWHPGT